MCIRDSLYSFYENNNGSPLATSIKAIKDIYEKLPEGVNIVRSCSTGYGEALIKSALMLDEGEVVECGPTENVVANPQSACAKKLMSSVYSLGGLD